MITAYLNPQSISRHDRFDTPKSKVLVPLFQGTYIEAAERAKKTIEVQVTTARGKDYKLTISLPYLRDWDGDDDGLVAYLGLV